MTPASTSLGTDGSAAAGVSLVAGAAAGQGARGRGDPVVIVRIDGRPAAVAHGTLVAAALAVAQPGRGTRVSRTVERRQAFCGMGVCGECRVMIDGRAHRLGCQVVCADGMEIRTDG